jgi:hypothetical protein
MAGTLKKRFQMPPNITPAAEARGSIIPRQFSKTVSEAFSAAPVTQTRA